MCLRQEKIANLKIRKKKLEKTRKLRKNSNDDVFFSCWRAVFDFVHFCFVFVSCVSEDICFCVFLFLEGKKVLAHKKTATKKKEFSCCNTVCFLFVFVFVCWMQHFFEFIFLFFCVF